jgi:hypothetical protein
LLLPASAQAASDAATTQAYVRADYRLVQTAASRLSTGDAAIKGVLAGVRRECPVAAAGSPQDPESTQLSNEVIGRMVTAALHTDLGSIREYVRAVSSLRWSSGSLTGAVHAYVGKLRTLASLSEPDLCGDVRAWSAGGFTHLPGTTAAFSPRFMEVWVALGEQPPGLARYESGQVRSLARRAQERETKLSEFEADHVETWGQIMSALQLWP